MNGDWQRCWPATMLACLVVCGCDEQPAVGGSSSDTSTTGIVFASTSTTGGCSIEVEGVGGGPGISPMSFGAVKTPERRAVPLGGGGLLVTRDATLAVASDPERDRLFVVALGDSGLTLQAEISLATGSEPGRLVEDDAGQVHVVLRGSGEVLTLEARSGQVLGQQHVCDEPRGLAYEAAVNAVHVACEQEAARSEHEAEHQADPSDVDQPVDARELAHAANVDFELRREGHLPETSGD